MKRIITLALLLALSLSAAQAAEWGEGLSPSQPHATVPEVNLEETLGYLMFYPNEELQAEAFCQTLYIYLPREDVWGGPGELTVHAEGEPEQRVMLSDPARVTQRPMTEREMDAFLWGSGTCFEVRLPRSLSLGKPCYATLAEGCFETATGVVSSAIEKKTAWAFALAGDYGISGLNCRRPLEDGTWEEGVPDARSGDELTLEVILGGEAQTAILYSRDASVDFTLSYLTESAPITCVVTGESPSWGVVFLDGAGNIVKQIEF